MNKFPAYFKWQGDDICEKQFQYLSIEITLHIYELHKNVRATNKLTKHKSYLSFAILLTGSLII